MKFFTLTALLAAAVVSAVISVPFLPAAKTVPEIFAIEARLVSNVLGRLQVFYDSGDGFNEQDSSRATLNPDPAPATYRLPIPPGTFRALRLDPIDRPGTVTLLSLKVVAETGRVLREIPLGDLQPGQQIQSAQLRADPALEIVTTPGADDPQLATLLSPPLEVRASWTELGRGIWWRSLVVFAALATLLFTLDRAPRIRATLRDAYDFLATRPTRAVALAALAAVIASAYPVVFLGKSYVSPNLGTALLYDTYPTLPGYRSTTTTDVKLSDIGAVMWQHVPFSMMQHRALALGELPLWNRYNALGVPLLAQGQSMFGDPLHLLVIAANGAAWAWDLKYLIAKWLFATGLGLIVLAMVGAQSCCTLAPAEAGRSKTGALLPSALLVTIAAPFIGFFLYRINHPAFFSLCYAPWPLYCLVRIAQATARRSIALWSAGLIAANLALMNSGTVKEAYMLLACVNFSGACVLLAHAAPWRERLAKLAVLAWAGVIFVLLTAPIWATFLQTLGSAYTGYNTVSAYQIQPTLLLGAFDEIFYRPLMSGDRVFSPSLNFLLLLGLLYFLATLRLHFQHRGAIALAASSLLPLSLAFGLISPQWITTLPFLGNIAHLDNTFSCVLIVLWSVLAGIGFATAAQRLGTREGRADLVIAALLLGALVFGWIGFRQASHRPIMGPTFTVNQPGEVLAISRFIWAYLVVLLTASIAFAWIAQAAFARRALTPARGLLLALCAVLLLWRHGLHGESVGFERYVAHPTVRTDFHARSEAMQRVRRAHREEPGRGYGLHSNFFPGWTGVYGLEGIHGPDALVNPWVRELVGLLPGVTRIWDWRLYVELEHLATARPFLDALNVRYYFDQQSDQEALGKTLALVAAADLDVYESPTAWPRAFFTDRIAVYNDPEEFVEMLRSANGRPLAALQRTHATPDPVLDPLPRDLATRTVTPATNYRLSENTTAFTVRATGPGVILLAEAFWPGDFRADVNGREAQIVRLNHAFKGVVVDAAGEYRVTFRYWPKNFLRNLLLCAGGAVMLAASLFFALRKARLDVARPSRPLSVEAGGTPALPTA